MDGICELCSEAVGYPAEHTAPFDTFQREPYRHLVGDGTFLDGSTYFLSVVVARAVLNAHVSDNSVFIVSSPHIYNYELHSNEKTIHLQ